MTTNLENLEKMRQARILREGPEKVRKAQKERNELEGLLRVLEVTDRVVAGTELSVFLSESPETGTVFDSAAAWTDGKDIFMNGSEVSAAKGRIDYRQFVASVKGLNYHELAHIIFTPRLSGKLANRVRSIGTSRNRLGEYWWSFNALEDQRAEMLFGGRHKIAYGYFKHVNLNFILRLPGQQFESLLPLMHGRLFLPTDLRHDLRRLFANKNGADKATRVTEIAERYITLNTNHWRHIDEAFDLVVELTELLHGTNAPEAPIGGHGVEPAPSDTGLSDEKLDGGSDGGRNMNPSAGQIRHDEPEDAEEELQNAVEKMIEADKQSEPYIEPMSPMPSSEEGEGDEDGDDEGDGSGESSSPEFSNKSAVDGAVKPDAFEQQDQINDAKDAAEKALEDSLSSAELSKDLDRTIDAAKAATKGDPKVEANKLGGYTSFPVTSDMLMSRNAVEPLLREIKLDLEPRWQAGQSSGILDPYRAMESELTGNMDIFDLWHEGSEEEGGIELVILLDMSSSMRTGSTWMRTPAAWSTQNPMNSDGAIVPASQAVWILLSALETIDVPVTVIGYNNGWKMLVFKGESESTNEYKLFDVSGGTDPVRALHEANTILTRSRQRNKVLAIFTDGQWASGSMDYFDPFGARSHRGSSNAVITAMREDDVTTVLFGVENAVKTYGDHGCEVAMDINSPMEMVDVVTAMVNNIMLKAEKNQE